MHATTAIRSKAGAALAATLLASSVLLSGCSGRDTELAEKAAAAEQSALRAEKAADRAVAAANKAEKPPAPVMEAEADPADAGNADAVSPEAGTADAGTPEGDKPLDPAPTTRS